MPTDASVLFQPLKVGDVEIKNRIVMAPLTRNRASHDNDAPNDLNVEYYTQRAGAGLIVTEATQISRQGQGYIYTPGIYSDAQVEGWTKVVKAIHAAGGVVFLQAWHVGRISHTSLQPDGGKPVAPSAIQAEGVQTYIESGMVAVSEPRALETGEIAGVVDDYRRAFANVKRAGFDGVEVHGANGYLLDEFMKSETNKRTDEYGGSVENRCRLTLEVVDAAIAVLGKGRVGIRLSPAPVQGAKDADPKATFGYLVAELGRRGIAYVHVIEGVTQTNRDAVVDWVALRQAFGGTYIANNLYDRETAIEAVKAGRVDAVCFGRAFISNPDLPERLRIGAPLAEDHKETWYGGDAKGYTDYPSLDAAKAAE